MQPAPQDAPRSGEPEIVELRQYTVRSGFGTVLPSLFREHFRAEHAAAGAHVLGTFFDLDDADRFVWLRAFRDMAHRKRALHAFYGGETWKRHRESANAAIVDSDNALLLHALPGTAMRMATGGVLRVSIRDLGAVDAPLFARWFDEGIVPLVRRAGVEPAARYAAEAAANDFPALPVRAENVFVWFAHFRDVPSERAFSQALARESGWRDACPVDVLPALMRKPEVLRLVTAA